MRILFSNGTAHRFAPQWFALGSPILLLISNQGLPLLETDIEVYASLIRTYPQTKTHIYLAVGHIATIKSLEIMLHYVYIFQYA